MKKPLLFLLIELLLCITCFSQTEVFSSPVTIKSGLNSAWEVVYGPNDSLWVTENKAYLVSRIKTTSPFTKTTLLNLTAQTDFLGSGPQPQGGLMGLAIHPNLYSTNAATRAAKPWVYIAYVYHRISSSCPSGPTSTSCNFNTRIVRYNYSGTTLSSPTIIFDGLPGSSDHNSGRLVISPVVEPGSDASHTQYRLYYTIGDMGAGQLTNTARTENAQNVDATEGKVLRLNTEIDNDGGADDWVPNDNPFYDNTDGISAKDYVFSMGHRNPQGLAWGNVAGNDILYSSEQMDRADDEINIIQKGHNYGWDKISGKADGDVNGFQIGQTAVTDEVNNSTLITSNTEPIFTLFHHNATWPSSYPANGSSNGPWPTVAVSSIDFYSQSVIPGWKNSLLMSPLKEDRFYRLKLNAAGDGISGDSTSYINGGGNRVRRVRVSPDGTKIYVARDAGATSNAGAILEYKFLGYAKDVSNKSTIPATVGITTSASTNTLISGNTVTIDASNNTLWVPITGPDGNILAEIYANGNNLGAVTSTFYIHSGPIRQDGTGRRYLDRSFTITPATQPTLPAGTPLVRIRLYFTTAEFNALDLNPNSGVSSVSDLYIRKNNDANSSALTNTALNLSPTNISPAPETRTDGYVLQTDINSFSSFYIGSNAVILPVKLNSFTANLENNTSLLKWETTNENNTSQFIVERSNDGRSYQKIGVVAANGNSTTTNKYVYTDYDVTKQPSSSVYYRLKMMDKDGSFTYSNVETIMLPFIAGRVTAFPNPATEEVNVSVGAPSDGLMQWKLMDNTGRIMLHNSTQIRKGVNNFSFNVTNLPVGLYYLHVSGAGVKQEIKLQKL